MKFSKLMVPLCVMLSLCGCAVGPDFHTPAPPNSNRYLPQHHLNTTARGQSFVMARHLPEQWWRVFHSQALDMLVLNGIRNSPDLASAKQKLKEAEEQLSVQFSHLMFPDVTASASFERQRTAGLAAGVAAGSPATFNIYDPQLSATYDLDVFGKNRRTIEMYAAQVDYARYEWEAAYLTLTTNIVKTVIMRAEYTAEIKATNALIAEEKEQLRITREQLGLGGQTLLAVSNLETQVAQTEALLPPLQKQYDASTHALSALLGEYTSEGHLPVIPLSKLHLAKHLPLTLPGTLVNQRPDILESQALLHEASAEIGVATANMLPDFSLSGVYGSTATTTKRLFTPNTIIWDFMAGLTQPIFNGGALWSYRKEKIAAYKAALFAYKQTVYNAFRSVADAMTNVYADADTYKRQLVARTAAKRALTITEQQYQLRGVNYLDVLNAQEQYQKTVVNVIEARAGTDMDVAELFQALGGGWQK